MITSPINPMRYWKLEEIQRMLNAIKGYENVVIEFQCQQADGWNKLNWDCKYGIKEQLVDGQWNWLLKHRFVIEAKTELDAHNLAWQTAAEQLVTDVWRTSINSFRKQQQELMRHYNSVYLCSTTDETDSINTPLQEQNENIKNNKLEAWGDYVEEYATRQKQLHKELVERKLMEMELENTTTEKTNMNNNIQTNNTTNNVTWKNSEPVRWFMSTAIVATVLFMMYSLYKYELILPTLFTLASIWGVASIIIYVKEAINRLLD